MEYKIQMPDRKIQAMTALFDYGTRPDATAAKVRKWMKKDGFTDAEIAAAAEDFGGSS